MIVEYSNLYRITKSVNCTELSENVDFWCKKWAVSAGRFRKFLWYDPGPSWDVSSVLLGFPRKFQFLYRKNQNLNCTELTILYRINQFCTEIQKNPDLSSKMSSNAIASSPYKFLSSARSPRPRNPSWGAPVEIKDFQVLKIELTQISVQEN